MTELSTTAQMRATEMAENALGRITGLALMGRARHGVGVVIFGALPSRVAKAAADLCADASWPKTHTPAAATATLTLTPLAAKDAPDTGGGLIRCGMVVVGGIGS